MSYINFEKLISTTFQEIIRHGVRKQEEKERVTLDRVRFSGTAVTSNFKLGGRGMPKAKPPYLKNPSGHIDQNKELWLPLRN